MYLGRPRSLWPAPDGSLYVGDAFGKHVIRFDRQGRPVQIYGEPGSGPGHFQGLGIIFTVDSLVVADDWGDRRLEMFHRSTGRHLASRRYEGVIGSVAVTDTSVWLGNLSVARETSLLVWRPGRESLEYTYPLPGVYLRSSPLRGIYTGVSVAVSRKSILVGYMGPNRLDVLNRSLERQRTMRVPVERRRGQPDDMLRKLERLPYPEKFSLLSGLFTMTRLPEGELALIHYDQTLTSVAARQVEIETYLSLLSADLDEACVDRPIPVAQANQPRMAIKNDSLFVLQQEVVEGAPRARSFVEIYEISPRGCEWQPVPHAQQPGPGS